MKRAIIIGSGISGMAIALRLAYEGFTVDVFEKESQAGGKIAQMESKGYRFDMGPSLFTLPNLVNDLFALFGKNPSEYLEYFDLDTTCNYYFPDKSTIKAWSNLQKFEDEVKKAGYNTEKLKAYLERQSYIYNHTSDFFLFNSIHKISTYFGKAGQKSLKALHKLDAFTTMHKRNKKTFGDTNLTRLFDRYATYNGSDPYRAPATLNMIAHLEHNTGAYFPKNGMYGIMDALYRLAIEEKINFHFNTTVSGLVKNKKMITAVETTQGTYHADIIVNSTDISNFYRQFLPAEKVLKRLMKRERSSSALIFYWGVHLTSPLDVHNILFSNDYKKEFEGLFKHKIFANDLTVYIFISKKVVGTDAPEGCENWFVMVNAPENVGQNWKQETEKVRTIVLQKIEDYLGIKVAPLIETESVITPSNIEMRTSSVNGSLYGHSSNSPLSAFLRHPNFSPSYKNLFFVGGSVHPGGGIPLCLASAKIAHDLIMKTKNLS